MFLSSFERIESKELPKEAYATTTRILLLALFRSMAELRNIMFVIDDGMYMDKKSWQFAMDLATSGQNIMDEAPPSKGLVL